MTRKIGQTFVAGLGGLAAIAVPAAVYAVPYTPPQSQLAAAVDLTGPFGGGGVVTSVQSAAGGARSPGNFDNMNGGSLNFSRIVLQRGGFNQDLSSFSSFDV